MVKNDKHRTRGLIDIYGNEYNIKENRLQDNNYNCIVI